MQYCPRRSRVNPSFGASRERNTKAEHPENHRPQLSATALTVPTREGQVKGPSPEARESGRYPKRSVRFAGFDVKVENERQTPRPPGGDREHYRAQHAVPYAYGYLAHTRGADGEEIDCFLGGDQKAEKAYVIRQLKSAGGYDEDKVMLGFHSMEEAEIAYRAAYDDGADDPTSRARDRVDRITEMSLDELKKWAYKAKESAVRVSFPVKGESGLRRDPSGQPILRLIASGTKLDASSGIDDEGRNVVGEKVAPMLLQKMVAQAKGDWTPQQKAAGGIYFIESHETTMPYGWVFDAGVEDIEDGNQQLWADVRLDMDNPMVPFFIKKFESGEYKPDCSVGLKVLKGTIWDADEGGYVGYLVDGFWEHIAMTKPLHPAYPDATLEDVYLEEESFASAAKAILVSVAKDIRDTQRKSAAGRKGNDMGDPLKIRAAEIAGLKDVNKGGDVHIHNAPPPAAPPAAPPPEKEAAFPPAKPAVAAPTAGPKGPLAAPPPTPPERKDEALAPGPPVPPPAPDAPTRGVSLNDLKAHLGSMKELMTKAADAGASPDELKAILTDVLDDVEEACEVIDEMTATAGEQMESESEAKKAKEAEDAKATKEAESESEAEARKAKEAADCKVKEAEDEANKKKDAEGDLVTKSREERRTRRMFRELNGTIKELAASNKEIKDKLAHLEATPAPRTPLRYPDAAAANGLRDRIGLEKSDALVTAIKEVKDPQARDLLSRAVSTDMLLNALGGQFPGLVEAQKVWEAEQIAKANAGRQ